MTYTKVIVSFAVGAVCGGVGTYFAVKKHFEDLADAEINEMREFMRDREKKHNEEISEWKQGADGDCEVIDSLTEEVKSLKKIIKDNGYSERTEADKQEEELAGREAPIEESGEEKPREGRRIIGAPVEVSLVEFEDGSPAYDHTCLTYYMEDEVMLYDADYEKVDDVRRLIGQAGIDALNRCISDGGGDFFIRNDHFGQMYEVEVVKASSNEAENLESGFVGE